MSLGTRLAPHHKVHLNLGARADVKWWATFLNDWNGKSFFPVPSASIEVTSDASGGFGCGGFSIPHGWFQIQWPESWRNTHITAKELVPVVTAAALWGHKWARQHVRFISDNMDVVDRLRSRTTKDTIVMHLLRCLTFYAAFYQFTFESRHVPGAQNTAADAISRHNISLFLSLVPQAMQVTIPPAVSDLLVNNLPDWGSPTPRSHLFRNSLTSLKELDNYHLKTPVNNVYQLLSLCSKIYTYYGLNRPLPLTELCSGLHFALGFLDSCELVSSPQIRQTAWQSSTPVDN